MTIDRGMGINGVKMGMEKGMDGKMSESYRRADGSMKDGKMMEGMMMRMEETERVIPVCWSAGVLKSLPFKSLHDRS